MQFHSNSIVLRSLAVASTVAFSQWASAAQITVANCTLTQAQCATAVQTANSTAFNSGTYPNVTGASGYTKLSTGYVTVSGSPNQPGVPAGNSSITLNNSQVSSQGQSGVALGTGVTGTFNGTATVANTSTPNVTASPVVNPYTLATAPVYLTTNSGITTASAPATNSYTLNFTTAESYLGLLWGSIGIGDLLTFYSAGNVVAQITGQDAINAATGFNGAMGARGPGGSQYTLINFLNGATFTAVTFSQTLQAAFESANIQYGTTNVSPVPEPGSIVLLGIGLAGLAAARRRKASRI